MTLQKLADFSRDKKLPSLLALLQILHSLIFSMSNFIRQQPEKW